MRITKSRLLQIIREEVELHEKNTLELDESFLSEEEKPTDKVTKKEFNKAIEDDQKEVGLEPENSTKNELEESGVEEDALFTKKLRDPKTGKMINKKIEPKKPNGVLSVKIR